MLLGLAKPTEYQPQHYEPFCLQDHSHFLLALLRFNIHIHNKAHDCFKSNFQFVANVTSSLKVLGENLIKHFLI